jgi:copper homeostasis protein
MLEVCAFHIDSCIIAERAGAKRVELCDNPVEGGTTPSFGTIALAREKIAIDLYPIIRPRAGNYFYTDEEFEIMLKDIDACKSLQCNGISIGIQKINGEVDKERFKRIVDRAWPMGVTSNRVIDAAPDPYKALEVLIEVGCERVLTSGQKSAAPDASDVLKSLVQQSAGRIIIMPGAGVKSSNIRQLKDATGASEFHSSARIIAPNPVTFLNQEILDYGHVYIADENEVRAMVNALDSEE